MGPQLASHAVPSYFKVNIYVHYGHALHCSVSVNYVDVGGLGTGRRSEAVGV